MEFDLDNVRSRIRVWYANGSTDELALEDDDDEVDDTEFDLSIYFTHVESVEALST